MRVPRYGKQVSVWIALTLSLVVISGCRPKLAVAAPTPDPVVIRFAYRQRTANMRPLFEEFHQKYPWITVEPVEVDRFSNQMDSVIRAGAADVFRESRSALSYAEEGLLKPLDILELGEWAAFQDDYYKGTWEGLSVQGRQWGIPAGLDALVVYVNLEQAKALNVAVPEPDWSVFDFVEFALEMNYPEGLPYQQSAKLFGCCTTVESFDPVVFIYLHGGRIVDDINNPTQATLDDPLTVEAIEWYSALFNVHNVAPDAEAIKRTFRRGGIYEAAVRGACGIWLGWYSNRGGLDTQFEWQSDWRMLPLPKDRAAFTLGEVEGYFISQDASHPLEILKLLQFLSERWEAAGQKLPPRRSLLHEDAYEDALGKDIAAVARTFSENVIIMPAENTPALQMVGGELIKAIKEVVAEDLDPADVLAEAQRKVTTAFETP